MKNFLDFLKKNCIGFPIVTELKEDFTNASHRISIRSEYGPVIIYLFETEKKIRCKNSKFLKFLKDNGVVNDEQFLQSITF